MPINQQMWQPHAEATSEVSRHMEVIQGFHTPAGHGGPRPLDREAAELFLRAQTSWLDMGLAWACDATAVGIVLTSHDDAHPSWLALIAVAHDTLGAAAGQALADLYAFQGRVAGVLHRGPDPRLSPTISGGVRSLLSDRLAQLTDAAVAAVSVAHGSPAAGVPAD
ncbi:MAG TPA: hypothetical protein VM287_03310 [Egibacteraceae bacterium]|nr:hypothetical protein [Egibacteraceae bacterium]